MSSSSGAEGPGEDGVGDDPAQLDKESEKSGVEARLPVRPNGDSIAAIVAEEMQDATPMENGFRGRTFRDIHASRLDSEDGSVEASRKRAESPSGPLRSTPDDTPSVQVRKHV
jgi:hypothetical protein